MKSAGILPQCTRQARTASASAKLKSSPPTVRPWTRMFAPIRVGRISQLMVTQKHGRHQEEQQQQDGDKMEASNRWLLKTNSSMAILPRLIMGLTTMTKRQEAKFCPPVPGVRIHRHHRPDTSQAPHRDPIRSAFTARRLASGHRCPDRKLGRHAGPIATFRPGQPAGRMAGGRHGDSGQSRPGRPGLGARHA